MYHQNTLKILSLQYVVMFAVYVHLQKKSMEKKKQFRRSENTNNSYSGQVKQGQEFVAHFLMEQVEAEKLWQENGEDAMLGDNDEGDSCNIAPAALSVRRFSPMDRKNP